MDDSWSARMAARAKARREAGEAREEAAHAEAVKPWTEFVEARGGYWADVWGDTYVHGHPAHGGATIDAATGRVLGVASVAIEEDAAPMVPPDVCPVCRDFAAFKP